MKEELRSSYKINKNNTYGMQEIKKRLNFTDLQKAKIYVRDKGICAFSGKILWALHYGASILFSEDWVDHIKPAKNGGDNTISNGVCASDFYNSKKSNNSYDNKYYFFEGRPTLEFFHAMGYIPEELKHYLLKMNNIQVSDWYFNRALSKLLIGVNRIIFEYDLRGNIFKRDVEYWCKAGFNKLCECRKYNNQETLNGFLERLSICKESMGKDQILMLNIYKANSIADFIETAFKLVPYYKNSHYFQQELTNIEGIEQGEILKNKIQNEVFLSERDKNVYLDILENPEILIPTNK